MLYRFVKGKDSVFGEVTDSWFRFEEQGRGSLHLHLLLWLKKEPVDEEPAGSQDSAGPDNDRSDTEERCVGILGCFAFLTPTSSVSILPFLFLARSSSHSSARPNWCARQVRQA